MYCYSVHSRVFGGSTLVEHTEFSRIRNSCIWCAYSALVNVVGYLSPESRRCSTSHQKADTGQVRDHSHRGCTQTDGFIKPLQPSLVIHQHKLERFLSCLSILSEEMDTSSEMPAPWLYGGVLRWTASYCFGFKVLILNYWKQTPMTRSLPKLGKTMVFL